MALSLASACVGDIGDPPQGSGTGPPGAGLGGAGAGALPGAIPGQPGAGATPGAGASVGAGATPGIGGAGGGVANRPCDEMAPDTGAGALPRLTSLEYQLTLQDLFALPSPPSIDGIPADAAKDGFKTFADLQTLSAQHLRAYLDVAGRLADELLADPARTSQVIGCALDAPDCLSAFVARFGKLAYRRPLEVDEVSGITTAAIDNALDVEDQYRFVIETLLASPSFLYRVEIGDASDAASALGRYELASRLSFTLWGRGPSEELLDQAADGALDTPQGFAQVVTDMTGDARAQRFLESFFAQWLGYEELPPPRQPPADWNDALLADMASETNRVIADFAWGGLDFLDLLTTNTTKLSAPLATFYGLPPPGADGAVQIPGSHPRANTGLLTHAALLSAKGDGDSIAIRGNWVRETFLCQGLEVPPEIAETFGERLVGLTRTEIVRERNTDTQCAGCHSVIDPIGIGFESFDATGRYQEGVDISPFGVTPALPDAPDPAFSTIAELAAKLRALPQVSECLTERVFLYTQGREPAAQDHCTVSAAAASFEAGGHDFPALLGALVQAPAFRLRRPPNAIP